MLEIEKHKYNIRLCKEVDKIATYVDIDSIYNNDNKQTKKLAA
jgi:hypothetical protein